MAQPIAPRTLAAGIYLNAFLVGGVLMGFEMLGSRYLNPFFGSGIGAWASLISMVLCALAIGYFIGGAIVDRYPSPLIIAIAIFVAAAYLALVPSTADWIMWGILAKVGDGAGAVLIASAALLLVPLTLLGTFSPVAVRLLVRSTSETGRVAGLVYGISTMGNVAGTLLTTFVLIPTIGVRMITYVYAGILAVCAVSLILPISKEVVRAAKVYFMGSNDSRPDAAQRLRGRRG
jgi:MFS family permease